ncbi:MAG: helix-turn-helix domain-containing protein, partial [Nitrospiraceae bacterium]
VLDHVRPTPPITLPEGIAMQKILTIKMVSELLHRHYNTTSRWVSEGLIPHASKIRGGWFIPENDIRRLLRAGRVQAAALRADPPTTTDVRPPSASRQSWPATLDRARHRGA